MMHRQEDRKKYESIIGTRSGHERRVSNVEEDLVTCLDDRHFLSFSNILRLPRLFVRTLGIYFTHPLLLFEITFLHSSRLQTILQVPRKKKAPPITPCYPEGYTVSSVGSSAINYGSESLKTNELEVLCAGALDLDMSFCDFEHQVVLLKTTVSSPISSQFPKTV